MSQEYLTVSALTKYLKRKFDVDPYLKRVYLTGEISNFRLRANGHQYFSLKDNEAKISAIMFKSAFQAIKFQPQDGDKVLVIGRISLYEPGGAYQIYIEHMEPDGIGALYQAFAQLREKLEKEGLFHAPKQPLPKYPKRIAVLTSPSGAVIRDIITTVQRRYPIAQLVLFPTLVQGEAAAADLVRNMQRVEENGSFDVMIIGRGGGSIEDLWAFNEERVARAIFQANVPVISSVGHETDVTIADLVADVRAPTPTAAAELAVPVLHEEIVKIKERQTRLEQGFLHILQQKTEQYKRIQQSYIFLQPERLYENQAIRLDKVKQQFVQVTYQLYRDKQQTTQRLLHQLYQKNPQNQLRESQQQLGYAQQLLRTYMQQYMKEAHKKIQTGMQQLDLLSPLKIMARGYTYTIKDEAVVKSAQMLHPQDQVAIHFTDGKALAVIQSIEKTEEKGSAYEKRNQSDI